MILYYQNGKAIDHNIKFKETVFNNNILVFILFIYLLQHSSFHFDSASSIKYD